MLSSLKQKESKSALPLKTEKNTYTPGEAHVKKTPDTMTRDSKRALFFVVGDFMIGQSSSPIQLIRLGSQRGTIDPSYQPRGWHSALTNHADRRCAQSQAVCK